MFLKTSRYYKLKVVEVGKVKAVKLRRLPGTEGVAAAVRGNDRLDIMAYKLYKDPARFWHIADANSELEANELVAETGRVIEIPEK